MLGEEERGQGSPMGRGGGYDTGVGGHRKIRPLRHTAKEAPVELPRMSP